MGLILVVGMGSIRCRPRRKGGASGVGTPRR